MPKEIVSAVVRETSVPATAIRIEVSDLIATAAALRGQAVALNPIRTKPIVARRSPSASLTTESLAWPKAFCPTGQTVGATIDTETGTIELAVGIGTAIGQGIVIGVGTENETENESAIGRVTAKVIVFHVLVGMMTAVGNVNAIGIASVTGIGIEKERATVTTTVPRAPEETMGRDIMIASDASEKNRVSVCTAVVR